MKIFNKIGHFFDRALDASVLISGIVLLLFTLSVSISVITRNFFNLHIHGLMEIGSYLVLLVTLVTAPWLLRKGEHISIDILPSRFRNKIIPIGSAVGSAMFLILTLYGVKVSWNMYKLNVTTESYLNFPRFIVISVVTISILYLAIQFYKNAVKEFKKMTENQL